MEQGQVRYIFDSFYRISTGNLHDVKGFGLGLSYVQYIVQQHDGEIDVKSDLGKGSEFIISLPNDR
jgi:two-component system phosphate regulon sensor histidine kinase PhoR